MAISSTNADVWIEIMKIDGGDVTGVAAIDVSGAATVGNLVANTGNVDLVKRKFVDVQHGSAGDHTHWCYWV